MKSTTTEPTPEDYAAAKAVDHNIFAETMTGHGGAWDDHRRSFDAGYAHALAAKRDETAALSAALARSEEELKLRDAQIADLTARLATSEERLWYSTEIPKIGIYRERAESAEAALATATAQLKEEKAHAQNMEWSEQKAQTAESALAAATARCGELEGCAVEWEKQAAFIEGPSKTIFGTPIESISGYDAGVAHTYRDCARAIRAAARPDAAPAKEGQG